MNFFPTPWSSMMVLISGVCVYQWCWVEVRHWVRDSVVCEGEKTRGCEGEKTQKTVKMLIYVFSFSALSQYAS